MSVVRQVTALAATLTLAAGAALVTAPTLSTAATGNRSLAKVLTSDGKRFDHEQASDFDVTHTKRCWLCLRPSRRRTVGVLTQGQGRV